MIKCIENIKRVLTTLDDEQKNIYLNQYDMDGLIKFMNQLNPIFTTYPCNLLLLLFH